VNNRGLKPVASAAGGHFQMQALVNRVSATVNEVLDSFHRVSNLRQALILGMFFPKMSTQPALPFVNVQHWLYLLGVDGIIA
jgi:hypothetical protein